MGERDPRLERFERDTVIAAGVLTGLVLMVPGWGWWMALSVLSGGLLAWLALAATKASADAAIRRGGRRWTLVKIFTRHAILAVAASVILARFRLHPAGVIAGTTVLVIAGTAAAVRVRRSSGPPGAAR